MKGLYQNWQKQGCKKEMSDLLWKTNFMLLLACLLPMHFLKVFEASTEAVWQTSHWSGEKPLLLWPNAGNDIYSFPILYKSELFQKENMSRTAFTYNHNTVGLLWGACIFLSMNGVFMCPPEPHVWRSQCNFINTVKMAKIVYLHMKMKKEARIEISRNHICFST